MNLVGPEKGLFNEDELKVLYSVGNQVAVALERAHLHEHLEVLVQERTAALEAEIVERKRIEKEQARLVAIIEATPDMVATGDPNGHVLYYNRAGLRMLGFEPGMDLSTVRFLDTHPDWAAKLVMEEGIPHAIEHGTWSGETALLRRDGCEIPISQVIIAHKGPDGSVEYLSTIARDITLQNEAEIRYRSVFESVVEGIFMVNPEGRVVSGNPALARMLGYASFDDLVVGARKVAQDIYVEPGSRGRFRETLEANGVVEKFETHWRRKDGSIIWVSLSARMTPGLMGGNIHHVGIAEDITERKQAEEEIKYKNMILQTQQETSLDAILVVDEDEKIISFNQQFIDLWRLSPQLVSAHLDAPVIQSVAEQVENSEAFFARVQYLHEHRDDKSREEIPLKDGRVIDRYSAPVTGADGQHYGRVWYFRDITERKLAHEEILHFNAELEERVQQRTEQLEFANKQMESFSYSVSHDLRSPLNAIDGFSSLLQKTVLMMESGPLTERSAHYLARIRAGVSQMGELIEGMLSLSLASRASLLWEPVDLSALANSLLGRYHEREPARAALLQVEAGLLAQGDSRLLKQVLDNLLGNAWKFSAGQVRTEIAVGHETGSTGETIYFVRDNGAGFDMAYADKLFGTFQRLHTQGEFAGTGIGLATVRRIIERHGGKIWGESTPGHGATFYFTLGTAML